jgi:hypothetical protein
MRIFLAIPMVLSSLTRYLCHLVAILPLTQPGPLLALGGSPVVRGAAFILSKPRPLLVTLRNVIWVKAT